MSATPEKDNSMDSALALMPQGRGFEIIDGKIIKDTDGLTMETRATVIEKVLENKEIMCQICLTRLSKALCKIEISNEFGDCMHDHGKLAIHIRIPLQLFHDMTHEDPFVPMNM
jgi:hypothetical protein